TRGCRKPTRLKVQRLFPASATAREPHACSQRNVATTSAPARSSYARLRALGRVHVSFWWVTSLMGRIDRSCALPLRYAHLTRGEGSESVPNLCACAAA